MAKRIYVGIIVFLFLTVWSFGYIDPGTGSYVIQVILGALVGVSLGVRIFWTKIKAFLGNIFSKKKEQENKEEQ